ncbi:MAG TPA: competence/damage-inducible protein A, partial [Candidatus Acidoferrum sp.]|nr:competence/damage-inducible protein A [Candidatus Acidoferrum sp.]
LNTHQQFLCRRFTDAGATVRRLTCVPDNGAAIEGAVRDALACADIVVTTGGLGPTSDDRTRDYIAGLLGAKLVVNETVLSRIENWFGGRKRPMPASTTIQAQVPEGAIVLLNEHGTAPGLIMEVSAGRFRDAQSWLVMLPGPPRELRPMFDSQVLPWLRNQFPTSAGFVCRTLKTSGIGESRVEEIIAPKLHELVQRGLEIGYCARTGEVDVRFVARGNGCETIAIEAETITRRLLGDCVFGADDEQLEETVVRLLTERKEWLALAESCTGGFIANRITNVPGASAVLWGGGVTYANDAKVRLLGVREETLREHGAVSEAVAREMAEGARRIAKSDYAIAVTGIAGPSGGTKDKPVGTVFIALATANDVQVKRALNNFDRETFKYISSQQALDMLRRALLAAHAGK